MDKGNSLGKSICETESQQSVSVSRRDFLGLAAALSVGLPIPIRSPQLEVYSLIAVELRGGNDGFNTVIPYRWSDYYKERPTLALNESQYVPLSDRLALNSNLIEIERLFRKGKARILTNVGCLAKPTRSHTLARSYWDETEFLSRSNKQCFQTGDDTSGDATRYLSHCSNDKMIDEVAHALSTSEGRLARVVIDDFDTHCHQMKTHPILLRQVSKLVSSLYERRKQQTVIFVYSEFGRSLKENNDYGTDHGPTSTCLLVGDNVRGGIDEREMDAADMPRQLANSLKSLV